MSTSNIDAREQLIGKCIKKIREEKGLTLTDLIKGADLGITEEELKDIENGKAIVYGATLMHILQYFNINLDRFIKYIKELEKASSDE